METQTWQQAWIGLYNPTPLNLNPRLWTWLDGYPNNTGLLWRPPVQPNNAGGNQQCVVATNADPVVGNWNDHDCATLNNAAVCETSEYWI